MGDSQNVFVTKHTLPLLLPVSIDQQGSLGSLSQRWPTKIPLGRVASSEGRSQDVWSNVSPGCRCAGAIAVGSMIFIWKLPPATVEKRCWRHQKFLPCIKIQLFATPCLLHRTREHHWHHWHHTISDLCVYHIVLYQKDLCNRPSIKQDCTYTPCLKIFVEHPHMQQYTKYNFQLQPFAVFFFKRCL